MKKFIILSILVFFSLPHYSHATEKSIKNKATIIAQCLVHITQIGAGAITTVTAIPLLGIWLVGKKIRPVTDQEPEPLYEYNNEGKKVDAGKAKYLCDFLAFSEQLVSEPVKDAEGKNLLDEKGEQVKIQAKTYVPMLIKNNTIIRPLVNEFVVIEKLMGDNQGNGLFDDTKLSKLDFTMTFFTKGGFILGVPMFIVGVASIEHGIEGLYKEIQKLKSK